MKFYTYIYRDPSRLNSKDFPEEIYVGKGKEQRAWKHLKDTKMHPFIQRLQLMKSNNVEPLIEIIDALDEDHAYFMEVCLIQVIGRKDLGKGPLLNLTNGGEGPSGRTPWNKNKKLTIAEKGIKPGHSNKAKEKMSFSHKGKKASLTTRTKMSAAQIAVKSKPCSVDGVTIYPSRKELIKALGQGKNGSNSPNFIYLGTS
jgi:hypothetical protein